MLLALGHETVALLLVVDEVFELDLHCEVGRGLLDLLQFASALFLFGQILHHARLAEGLVDLAVDLAPEFVLSHLVAQLVPKFRPLALHFVYLLLDLVSVALDLARMLLKHPLVVALALLEVSFKLLSGQVDD